jgi:predicted outer membrane protein
MRPRPPVHGRGIFSGTGLIITGLAATLAALIFSMWSYTDRPVAGPDVLSAQTVPTSYGPLSALDQDFLTKVRLAGLWELPAGQQARVKGTTPAVRTAGQHLVEGHRFLDERVRGVASRLNLTLPDEPSDQQRQWLDTLDEAQGAEYDRQFANILRLAHGKVFSVVAQVRASTRNSLVRELADDANTTVLDHIKVLEATGYVDFDAMARDMAADSTPPALDPGPLVSLTPSPAPAYPLPPPTSSPPPEQPNGTSHTGNTPSGL